VTLSLGYVAVYVTLAGVASVIEKPVGRGFGAVQFNALIRAGSLAAAAVALFFTPGPVIPAFPYILAGLGIGLLSGMGSLIYCFALDYMPVSLVVTFSNLYIVITIALGIAVLREPVTALKIGGLTCIVAGISLLAHSPARYAVSPEVRSGSKPLQARAFAIVSTYVVIIGVAAFLEKPALRGMHATQLNALMAIAMTAVAGIALAAKGPRLPMATPTLRGFGIGVMIGTASVFYFLGLRELPVSVAATSSNAYVVVTVGLSALFLHEPLSRARGGAMALTLLGVTLLALSPA